MILTPLIISYKSTNKLENCIKYFGHRIKSIVVENSNSLNIKKIEKRYNKLKVILNKKNFGYGKAANIGLKKIKSQFALLINTDVKITISQIKQLEKIIRKYKNKFTLASPMYNDLMLFYKTNNFNHYFLQKNLKNTTDFQEVNFLKGSVIIIDLKKFKTKKVFDEKFFFFFEELDLCKKVREKNENIFLFKKINVIHKGGQSIDLDDKKYSNFRNWNFYWSSFYFQKKHFGLYSSLKKHSGKLIRFFISTLFFYFFSKHKHESSKYRLLGLLASIFNFKSNISNSFLLK